LARRFLADQRHARKSIQLFARCRRRDIIADMSISATALAPSNIAFVKYWGKPDDTLRLP